jgi:hypothetical protein
VYLLVVQKGNTIMNIQQQIIIQACYDEIERREINCDRESFVEDLVMRKIPRLNPGEYLVMKIEENSLTDIERLDGFHSAQNIDIESILISSAILENKFHEQYQF